MKVAIQVLRCLTFFKLRNRIYIKDYTIKKLFLHAPSDNVLHCQYLDHTDAYHVDAAGDPLAYWNGTLTIRFIYLNVFNLDYHIVYQSLHFMCSYKN